jgi:hypothetical protein
LAQKVKPTISNYEIQKISAIGSVQDIQESGKVYLFNDNSESYSILNNGRISSAIEVQRKKSIAKDLSNCIIKTEPIVEQSEHGLNFLKSTLIDEKKRIDDTVAKNLLFEAFQKPPDELTNLEQSSSISKKVVYKIKPVDFNKIYEPKKVWAGSIGEIGKKAERKVTAEDAKIKIQKRRGPGRNPEPTSIDESSEDYLRMLSFSVKGIESNSSNIELDQTDQEKLSADDKIAQSETMVTKNKVFKFQPLPIVSCVEFKGLSGKMKQNTAMLQIFATIYKIMSQCYGNREVDIYIAIVSIKIFIFFNRWLSRWVY